jgi:IPT/TIG domain-containing protein
MKPKLTAGLLAAAALSLFVVQPGLHAGVEPPFAGVSLKVSRETAPPGGIAQVKMEITEPRPISTGGLRFRSEGWDVAGVAAMSPANDSYGVAQVDNGQVQFAIASPTGSFGTDPDYPVFTVALRVPATSALGTISPVGLEGDPPRFISPAGTVYPTDIKDGWVTVNRGISIDDVVPGSSDLAAGSVVTIVGRGFRPTTRIKFGETILSAVRFIDSTHMQVVLASAARMHGMRIRAENKDGAKTEYF